MKPAPPLLLLAALLPSCTNDDHQAAHAGQVQLRVVVDDRPASAAEIDRAFSMRVVTAHDSLLLRPRQARLRLPVLPDSLQRVTIRYGDFTLVGLRGLLREDPTTFYFPEADTATLLIDHYPFTTPTARQWEQLTPEQVYYELNAINRLRGRQKKGI